MTNPFFTIGHSTHAIPDFAALLQKGRVETVVDVRKMPRSRTNPQFNREAIGESLAEYQIGYAYLEALGGLRAKQTGVSPPNDHWENRSFRNYADYAMSERFRAGFEELLELGRGRRCAIMCAEAVWWRCHRRIIADYLLNAGADVFHILQPDRIDPARLTPGAQAVCDRKLAYPGAKQLG